jgi:beta-lactamase regulating signal transducer with metallopeptidase domain
MNLPLLVLALPSPAEAAAAAATAARVVGCDPTGALNGAAPGLLDALWRAGWQGGLAVLAALAVTRLLRKQMSPAVAAAVWWLACAKLTLGLALAAVGPVELPILPPAAEQTLTPLTAVIQTGSLGGRKPSRPAAAPALGRKGGTSSSPPAPPSSPAPNSAAAAGAAPSAPPPAAAPAASRVRETPTPAVLLVVFWAAGVLCHAGLALRQFRLARGLVARAHALTGEDGETARGLLRETAGLAGRLGLAQAPRLMTSDEIAGPLLVGVGRGASGSAVLLPSAMVSGPAALTTAELRLVLAHELAHVRRLDPLLGLVPALTMALFFFHPLARLACREWDVAREAACDAAALEATGDRADRYGSLLVKLGALAAATLAAGAASVRRGAVVAPAPTPGGGAALGAASSGYAALRRRLMFLQQALRPGSRRSRRGGRAARATVLGAVALTGLIPWRPVAAPVPAPSPATGEEAGSTRVRTSAPETPGRAATGTAKPVAPVAGPRSATAAPRVRAAVVRTAVRRTERRRPAVRRHTPPATPPSVLARHASPAVSPVPESAATVERPSAPQLTFTAAVRDVAAATATADLGGVAPDATAALLLAALDADDAGRDALAGAVPDGGSAAVAVAPAAPQDGDDGAPTVAAAPSPVALTDAPSGIPVSTGRAALPPSVSANDSLTAPAQTVARGGFTRTPAPSPAPSMTPPVIDVPAPTPDAGMGGEAAPLPPVVSTESVAPPPPAGEGPGAPGTAAPGQMLRSPSPAVFGG